MCFLNYLCIRKKKIRNNLININSNNIISEYDKEVNINSNNQNNILSNNTISEYNNEKKILLKSNILLNKIIFKNNYDIYVDADGNFDQYLLQDLMNFANSNKVKGNHIRILDGYGYYNNLKLNNN